MQTCYGSFSVYRSSSGTTTADGLKIKAEEKFEGMIRANAAIAFECVHTYVYVHGCSASLVCCNNGNSTARSTIPAGSAMGKNKEHNRLHPRGFPVRDRTSVSYQL